MSGDIAGSQARASKSSVSGAPGAVETRIARVESLRLVYVRSATATMLLPSAVQPHGSVYWVMSEILRRTDGEAMSSSKMRFAPRSSERNAMRLPSGETIGSESGTRPSVSGTAVAWSRPGLSGAFQMRLHQSKTKNEPSGATDGAPPR